MRFLDDLDVAHRRPGRYPVPSPCPGQQPGAGLGAGQDLIIGLPGSYPAVACTPGTETGVSEAITYPWHCQTGPEPGRGLSERPLYVLRLAAPRPIGHGTGRGTVIGFRHRDRWTAPARCRR